MKSRACLALVGLLLVPALASARGRDDLAKVNAKIQGKVVDYTHNGNADRRIYSKALQERRDLYVYLPPRYDPCRQYPLVIYLHGVLQDEKGFLEHGVKPLDDAIASGQLPPLIVAAPDGSLSGSPSRYDPGSFFVNGPAGDYQDWVVNDVWRFVTTEYSVRPEPEAHALLGVSMGGFGAFNIGIKHRDKFRIVVGVLPVLNLRWMDLKGNYFANFDPYNWGWRNCADDPKEVVGRFAHGLIKLRMEELLYPVFGEGFEGILRASFENPIEMVDRYRLRNGELDMYVGYGGEDEFNLDAHAESFIYLLKSRGIRATVYKDPAGRHSEHTAVKMVPGIIEWLGERLRAYHVDDPCCIVEGR